MKERWLVASIVLLGLILNLTGVTWGLQYGTWLPDGEIEFALKIGQTKDLNPHFFVNPHVYTYALFALYILLYLVFRLRGIELGAYASVDDVPIEAKMWLYLVPRLFSVICTIMSAVLVYYLVRRIGKPIAAWFAAMFFTVSMTFVTYAHFEGRYALTVFLLLLPLYFLELFVEQKKRLWLILASLFIGLSSSTKYFNAFLVFPLLVSMIYVYGRRWMLYAKRGLLSGALIIIGFLAGTPYALLDYPTFLKDIKFIFLVKDSNGYNGLFSPYPVWRFFPSILANGFGIVLFTALVLLCIYAIFKSRDKRRVLMLMSLSFIVPYVVMLGSGHFFTTRYLIPIQAFLIVLASVGIACVYDWKKTHAATGILLFVVLISGLYAYSADLMMERDSRYEAREWIVKNVPKGTTIDHFYRSAKFVPYLSDRYNFRLFTIVGERGSDSNEKLFTEFLSNYTKGEYIILSSFEYGAYIPDEDKYFSGAMNLGYLPNYPARTQFYDDLLSGRFGYEKVKEFKYRTLFFPHPDFVNPTIILLKKSAVN